MNEHGLTYGESLSGSMNFLISYQLYSVRSGQKDVNSVYNVLIAEGMADATVLRKRVRGRECFVRLHSISGEHSEQQFQSLDSSR